MDIRHTALEVVNKSLEAVAECANSQNHTNLVNVTVAQIILFNKRWDVDEPWRRRRGSQTRRLWSHDCATCAARAGRRCRMTSRTPSMSRRISARISGRWRWRGTTPMKSWLLLPTADHAESCEDGRLCLRLFVVGNVRLNLLELANRYYYFRYWLL